MRPVIECVRCGERKSHYARSLCGACYQAVRKAGDLVDFEVERDFSLDVDEVVVDRAVAWLLCYHRTVPTAERYDKRHFVDRPRMSRGERIEVLRRTRHAVPRWVAVRGLGISSKLAHQYFEDAGVAA